MDFYLLLKNMGKSLSNKFGQKILDSAKESAADIICSKKSNSKNSRSNLWFDW